MSGLIEGSLLGGIARTVEVNFMSSKLVRYGGVGVNIGSM